jgi:hypothetical protein
MLTAENTIPSKNGGAEMLSCCSHWKCSKYLPMAPKHDLKHGMMEAEIVAVFI